MSYIFDIICWSGSAMFLHQVANQVRDRRKALGLSQAQLGELAGLSRATIVDLEAGRVSELGITRFEKVLAALGYSLGLTEGPARKTSKIRTADPLNVAARTASVSYRDILSVPILEESLVTGKLPEQYRAHLASLINEAPAPLLVRVVDAAAQRRHVKPKAIWKNLSRWSQELQTTRTL